MARPGDGTGPALPVLALVLVLIAPASGSAAHPSTTAHPSAAPDPVSGALAGFGPLPLVGARGAGVRSPPAGFAPFPPAPDTATPASSRNPTAPARISAGLPPRAPLLAAPGGLFLPAGLRPIRTNEPGTGVFIGSGLLGRVIFDRERAEGEELRSWTALADFRYTPATHWVFGARLPVLLDRTLEGPAGSVSTGGLGDVVLGVKRRFFRRVGKWADRHAALEVDVKLPTGSASIPEAPGVPLSRRGRLRPGSGSVDFAADLIYQEGRQRLVYGGDLAFRLNTRGREGYRVGNEMRLNLDVEYIVLPLEYRRPGREVFLLLETTVRRKWEDGSRGVALSGTGRTDLLLAPAVQHILGEQSLVSLSVQFPVVSDAGPGGLEQGLNVLAEVRYAF